MKTLIAYFSRRGENYFSGQIRRVNKGNTEIAADMIHDLTGGDLLPIVMTHPYSDNYDECTEQAMKDKKEGRLPELSGLPDSLKDYDKVYLGYPIYWGTFPMAVAAFLKKYDWKGKTICPFCTHEGSGLGGSVSDAARLAKGAKVTKGLAIKGIQIGQGESLIKMWMEEIQ